MAKVERPGPRRGAVGGGEDRALEELEGVVDTALQDRVIEYHLGAAVYQLAVNFSYGVGVRRLVIQTDADNGRRYCRLV